VVDLTATGTTLKENGLEIVDTIFETTARLIANKIKLRVNYTAISALAKKLQAAARAKK
jgi:ATP phosphoribosyltransferase